MKEEDFIKVWKDSDRDRILHQYYYDYLEMQRLGNIIDELEKYIIDEYYIDDWEEKVLLQKDLINKLQELKEEGKK